MINRTKTAFVLLIALGTFLSVNAQTERAQIYKAFITGDMNEWKTTMNVFAIRSTTDAQKIELINYYYGYVAYEIGIGKKEEAKIYLNKGETLIDALLKTNASKADLYAYKAAFIGFKIGISPLKAPFIGKSSIENAKKAMELDATSVQANIERGNILYYSPSAFGGNKTEAKKYYLKAIELFEANSANTKDNWLYLSLMTSLAKIYTEEGKNKEAKTLYEKILAIEPSYKYVKDELYPAILKKK